MAALALGRGLQPQGKVCQRMTALHQVRILLLLIPPRARYRLGLQSIQRKRIHTKLISIQDGSYFV